MNARINQIGSRMPREPALAGLPAAPASRRSRRRLLGSLLRDSEGTAAIEFAVIAPLFFALMFSFYDLGMIMLRQVLLQSAVEKSVRTLRVDLANQQTDAVQRTIDRNAFKQDVCARAMILRDCADTIVIETTSLGRFAATPPPPGSPCQPSTAATMQVGARNDIVVMRVCAVANPIIPTFGLGPALVRDSNGDVRVISTTAYLNE